MTPRSEGASSGVGLLDEVVHPDQGLLRRGSAATLPYEEISARGDLLEGQDRRPVALVGGQHAGQDPGLLVHDVVAEHDHERLVATWSRATDTAWPSPSGSPWRT